MAERHSVVVTGLAVMAGDAPDAAAFAAMLRETRAGAGVPLAGFDWEARLAAIAARAPAMAGRTRRAGRSAGRALQATLSVALEAVGDAALDPATLAVVIAGSNLQLGRAWQAYQRFQTQPAWLSPRHGYEFYDTHVLAVIAEALAARGPGLTVGGASASGNVAIATALDLVRHGRAAACLVVGPLPDLSPAEWHALGAMGALARAEAPACRPFDRAAAGFVPGEACGALLLECAAQASERGVAPLAEIAGASCVMGASQQPSPDPDGEWRAMAGALADADARLDELDYVSAHATSTPGGDAAECEALRRLLGERRGDVPVNATKSLTGHALHAAGVVEAIALILQMRGGFIHGTAGLADPIARDLFLVGPATIERRIRLGLSNSFGFGSIAASVLVRDPERAR